MEKDTPLRSFFSYHSGFVICVFAANDDPFNLQYVRFHGDGHSAALVKGMTFMQVCMALDNRPEFLSQESMLYAFTREPIINESERPDLNRRPPAPKAGALDQAELRSVSV